MRRVCAFLLIHDATTTATLMVYRRLTIQSDSDKSVTSSIQIKECVPDSGNCNRNTHKHFGSGLRVVVD